MDRTLRGRVSQNDRDKWRKYVHGVADLRIEDGYRTELNRNMKLTPQGDDSKDDPGGPIRQVLDEHESHQSTDHNKVGLLQA